MSLKSYMVPTGSNADHWDDGTPLLPGVPTPAPEELTARDEDLIATKLVDVTNDIPDPELYKKLLDAQEDPDTDYAEAIKDLPDPYEVAEQRDTEEASKDDLSVSEPVSEIAPGAEAPVLNPPKETAAQRRKREQSESEEAAKNNSTSGGDQ